MPRPYKPRLRPLLHFLSQPVLSIPLHQHPPSQILPWSATVSSSLLGILKTFLISLGMTVVTTALEAATDLEAMAVLVVPVPVREA